MSFCVVIWVFLVVIVVFIVDVVVDFVVEVCIGRIIFEVLGIFFVIVRVMVCLLFKKLIFNSVVVFVVVNFRSGISGVV